MFDQAYIKDRLKRDDWFLELGPQIREIFSTDGDAGERKQILKLAAELLSEGKLALPKSGPDLDGERQSVDTIVVHHTVSSIPNLDYLSALGLFRLYVGESTWSGHFIGRKQVFFPYHFLIYKSGKVTRLLDDKCIGWHAGNWDINTRSVGIALEGNFEFKNPTSVQIKSLANLIAKNYPEVSNSCIFGHCEVVKTKCPGGGFQKWKKKILRSN